MLQDVFIVNNRLTALPMVLYSVPSLQNILAGDNKIECINVEGLMNLTNLTCLDLHNNSIQQVPPLLGRMEWLRYMYIHVLCTCTCIYMYCVHVPHVNHILLLLCYNH